MDIFRSFICGSRTGKALLMALAALVTIATVASAAQGRRGPKVKSITVAAAERSGDKAITAFSFAGLTPAVTGTINEADHTIALTVPYGTTVTALKATFTASTGASVKVGTTAQTSGTTANDFSSAVTYTVTAEDGSTQDYTVTVTVKALAVGDSYGGGIVVYLVPSNQTSAQGNIPAYDANNPHGLIAATEDQSTGTPWSNVTTTAVTGTGTGIGTGAANTLAITSQEGHTASAAKVCAEYSVAVGGVTYGDWYLPSKDELDKLYLYYWNDGATKRGGFVVAYYWSSSELLDVPNFAWRQGFLCGRQNNYFKRDNNARVRPVRAF